MWPLWLVPLGVGLLMKLCAVVLTYVYILQIYATSSTSYKLVDAFWKLSEDKNHHPSKRERGNPRKDQLATGSIDAVLA